jgi:hypothetical protein
MTCLHVFADEAGCFTFERRHNVSRYFILCTVAMHDCAIADDLLNLRRKLAWNGMPLGEYFHATADQQDVRDRVFEVISKHDFQVQTTLMEKSKAQPHVRLSRPAFYQYGWFYHFKYGVSKRISPTIDTLVTAAALGTRKEKSAFQGAVNDVMKQTMSPGRWRTDFCPAAADPCLQVADYCAWAIQRKHERSDDRSYNLIKDRITYEYDLWSHGIVHYY